MKYFSSTTPNYYPKGNHNYDYKLLDFQGIKMLN